MARVSPERHTVNIVVSDLIVRDGETIRDLKTDTPYVNFQRLYGGNITPNFREKAKSGDLPFNPFSMSKVLMNGGVCESSTTAFYKAYPVGKRETTFKQLKTYIWEDYVTPPIRFGHIDEAYSKASSRLLDEMSDVKLNLAQFFAERKQVIDMIGSTAQRIASAARALKQGRFGDVYRSLGISYQHGTVQRMQRETAKWSKKPTKPRDLLANYWLEFQYGWRPLLSDVYAGAELIAEAYTPMAKPKVLRASASASRVSKLIAHNPVYPFQELTGGELISKTHCKVAAEITPTDDAKRILAQTGISNPALLIWELVPYSFVVDWFLPVGNYLSSLNATSGFRVGAVATTEFTRSGAMCSASFSGSYPDSYQGTVNYASSVSGSADAVLYNRSIRLFPQPTLRLKDPVSVTHALNAIALVNNVFRR